MQTVTIRAASTDDIPQLAHLWHEQRVILQQLDRRFDVPPNSEQQWSHRVEQWLTDAHCAIFVAENQSQAVGYIVGWIETAPYDLLPDRTGLVTDIALDLHHYHAGLGRSLLRTLGNWFVAQGVRQVAISVPRHHVVAQTFWRSVGAKELLDVLWLRL